MKTSTVTSHGVRLAVFEQGDPERQTVLLVHGYPDTHAVWDEVAEALAEDYHVVRYDVRGAGASQVPSTQDGYRLELLGADLMAVADAVSPHQPVHVVAHDWGSIQSWEAVTEPGNEHRIASYTSISGPCLDHVGHWMRRRPTPRVLGQLINQQLHSWYIVAFHLPVLAKAAWRLGLGRNWAKVLARLEGVRRRPGHPAPTITSDGVHGISLYRANFIPRLRNPRERRTTVPVQVIQPVGDRYATMALAEGLQRWVPKLWLRKVMARHWAPVTHPEAITRMVREFVGHVDGAPASLALRRDQVRAARSPFADKLVVITGAGSGIGRATALAFAKQGAEVVVCDLDPVTAKETAELAGTRAHAYQVNVADEEAVRQFAAQVAAEHGVPDVVVNNAGIGHSGTILDTTSAQWTKVLDVNLWGVIHGCRAFGELMVRRGEGGHIVNLASAAAYLPSKVLGAYATSKAAVFMLSDCLRAELAEHGIGVSAICPGLVRTNITRTTTFSGVSAAEQAAKQARTSQLYARRNFPPEGVAAEILTAVRRNRPVVPVTVESKAALLLSRVSPATLRAAAKIQAT
ncbi:SDR family oxidoreductase [Kutzneria albida]|uniref:Putative oxidoreductase ephD n=1 Tax=Kutzneria albida DSM 43870 TaxID=1449976 RepID=W5WCS3_9PSEU|nr:SDR family oxidoreductase [Kutzneria albida]AHH96019.1 putative oxidoreductase ephD [Kutzneria albida DSM 43870]